MHLSSLPAGDYPILDQKAHDPEISWPTLKSRTVPNIYSSTKRCNWDKMKRKDTNKRIRNMEAAEIRLFQESSQSFIYHIEESDFGIYHHHPEYELVLIDKGSGVRVVGDTIDDFKKGDLVFLAPNLPHVWRCDSKYIQNDGAFTGKGYVIQFTKGFFGQKFLELPENKGLAEFLVYASRGCRFFGKTKQLLTEKVLEMQRMKPTQRFYALFAIFGVLATTTEYELISSPAFYNIRQTTESGPLHNVVEYILEHFKEDIKLKDVLEVANMGNTQFFFAFKKTYRMPFKSYLSKLRIGSACRLLAEPSYNISEVAYNSGFENLSNFNRHFKSIKGCTPTTYRKKLEQKIIA